MALVTALVVLGRDARRPRIRSALAAVKRRIHADLLEMRLYNDDLRGAAPRAGRAAARTTRRYLWLSLLPLVITALPLTLRHRAGAGWYGYSGPATPASPRLVTADLRGAAPPALPQLEAPASTSTGRRCYFPTPAPGRLARGAARAGRARAAACASAAATRPWRRSLHVGAGDVRPPLARRATAPASCTSCSYPSEAPTARRRRPSRRSASPIRSGRCACSGVELHWLWVYLA